MTELAADITPDKSLIKKLGLVGYRTEQAVAELIDNSIDARLGGTETIKVRLDFGLGQIEVLDDGCGMDFDGLRDALTVAKETKDGKLGQFGLGLKSACSSLGKSFALSTSTRESRSVLVAKYDEDRWLNDTAKDWTNFLIERDDEKGDWHGTRITISKIKVPLYPNQLVNFRRRFGVRYGPYLESGQVRILVNSHPCAPSTPELADGMKHTLDIVTTGGRLRGWIGLLRKRSIKGDYGIHLYRLGRLIRAFDKFGINFHPKTARVVGELSLDHIPVNFHKTGFLTETPEYGEAVSCFAADSTVRDVVNHDSSRKADASDMESVLALDKKPGLLLDARMNSAHAKALLREADRIVRRKDGVVFDFRFNDSDALCIESDEGRVRVDIGRTSPAFRLFKNPLFLAGMIRMEAELVAENPSYRPFVERRNRMLNEFVRTWLPQQTRMAVSVQRDVPLPGYSLNGDLVEMHDYLKENFEHDFQFTGLSTLASFLHNAHQKLVYAIHTVPGAGQSLLEAIYDNTDKFVVRLNSGRGDLSAMLESTKHDRFVVVREYRDRFPTSWAKPEKAWLDLYFDVTRDRIPLYRDELILVLDELLDAGLASPARLRTLARRRQILREVEEYLPEE